MVSFNGVEAGRDIEVNVTYQYFQASPPRLRLSFDAYMDGKLEYFVGRQFVFDALDEFTKANSSGYFIIRAGPGMGKSSLLSWLIRDRGYIHHFNIAPQNIRSPREFLENICLQLVARYNLPHTSLPTNAGDDSGFLMQCLSEAAADSKNHPIVLAVDSLDESDRTGLGANTNILYLPDYLPLGVFVVATTRPLKEGRLPIGSPMQYFDIKPDSTQNASDIDKYTSNFIERSSNLRDRLAESNKAPETFISEIYQKSQGNFMYLRYVLPAIAEGKFKLDTLETLPDGLLGYYQRHWELMKEGREEAVFKSLVRPIICMLGVAREHIAMKQIATFTKIDFDDVRMYIALWREFLSEIPVQKYLIYHASFQDFLKEQVDLDQYHDMISDYYDSLVPKNQETV